MHPLPILKSLVDDFSSIFRKRLFHPIFGQAKNPPIASPKKDTEWKGRETASSTIFLLRSPILLDMELEFFSDFPLQIPIIRLVVKLHSSNYTMVYNSNL